MKRFTHLTRSLLASALLALPLTSFAADALMEPVKSVLDHYLMIQSDLAKDSIKGLDEHENAVVKTIGSGFQDGPTRVSSVPSPISRPQTIHDHGS